MAKFSIGKWRKKAVSMYGTARGLTKAQRDKVTKAVRGKTYNKSGGRTTRRKTVAKKRTVRKRRFTFPIAVVGGLGAGLLLRPPAWYKSPLEEAQAGNYNFALKSLLWNYTGLNAYDGKWNPLQARGLLALGGGLLMHKAASMLGLNRILGRSGIPFIRI